MGGEKKNRSPVYRELPSCAKTSGDIKITLKNCLKITIVKFTEKMNVYVKNIDVYP